MARLTLAHVLARITTEHGPTFANVTEEKLQTQIDKLDDEDDADMEDINPNNDAKQVTREDLIKIVQYSPQLTRLIAESRLKSRPLHRILPRCCFLPRDLLPVELPCLLR